jgi:hypothetical protein
LRRGVPWSDRVTSLLQSILCQSAVGPHTAGLMTALREGTSVRCRRSGIIGHLGPQRSRAWACLVQTCWRREVTRLELRKRAWCDFLLSVWVVRVSAIGEMLRRRARGLLRVEGLRAAWEELLTVEREGGREWLDRIASLRLP